MIERWAQRAVQRQARPQSYNAWRVYQAAPWWLLALAVLVALALYV